MQSSVHKFKTFLSPNPSVHSKKDFPKARYLSCLLHTFLCLSKRKPSSYSSCSFIHRTSTERVFIPLVRAVIVRSRLAALFIATYLKSALSYIYERRSAPLIIIVRSNERMIGGWNVVVGHIEPTSVVML